MARKHQFSGHPYTCQNAKFHTNIRKGFPHGSAQAGGSVFDQPLLPGNYSLWLEYVVENSGLPAQSSQNDLYWLMWYDQNGDPLLPASAVLTKANLREMVGLLANFVP